MANKSDGIKLTSVDTTEPMDEETAELTTGETEQKTDHIEADSEMVKADETPVLSESESLEQYNESEASEEPMITRAKGKSAIYFCIGVLSGLLLAVLILAYPAFISLQVGETQQAKLQQTASESHFYQVSAAMKESQILALQIEATKSRLAELQQRRNEIIQTEAAYQTIIAEKSSINNELDELNAEVTRLTAQLDASDSKISALREQEAFVTEPLAEQIPDVLKDKLQQLMQND